MVEQLLKLHLSSASLKESDLFPSGGGSRQPFRFLFFFSGIRLAKLGDLKILLSFTVSQLFCDLYDQQRLKCTGLHKHCLSCRILDGIDSSSSRNYHHLSEMVCTISKKGLSLFESSAHRKDLTYEGAKRRAKLKKINRVKEKTKKFSKRTGSFSS